jgi:hypothetical protein
MLFYPVAVCPADACKVAVNPTAASTVAVRPSEHLAAATILCVRPTDASIGADHPAATRIAAAKLRQCLSAQIAMPAAAALVDMHAASIAVPE